MTSVWLPIVTDFFLFVATFRLVVQQKTRALHIASRRNFLSHNIELLSVAETDGLRVRQATLCGCFYQSVPDNITIFRYLCLPPKHFIQSRGSFWYGCRLLIRNVWVNRFNPYPTAFPYGNGMVLHFYQQQESSTTKTVHKVFNKGLKAYV